MHQHEPGVLMPTSLNCYRPSHSSTQLLFLPSKGYSISGTTLQTSPVPVPVRQPFVNTCDAMQSYWGRPFFSTLSCRKEHDERKTKTKTRTKETCTQHRIAAYSKRWARPALLSLPHLPVPPPPPGRQRNHPPDLNRAQEGQDRRGCPVVQRKQSDGRSPWELPPICLPQHSGLQRPSLVSGNEAVVGLSLAAAAPQVFV